MRLASLAFAALIGLALPVAAAERVWTVVPEESRLLFEYERGDRLAEGRFSAFTGRGRFERAAPEEASLELRIESNSIDLGNKLESAFATSAEWFDSANHPVIVYRLMKLTPEGDGRYRAEGELTMRGRTRPIVTTVTMDIGADAVRASGSLRMDRKDYRLGVGPMSLFVDIGREVAVSFDLTAHPAR